MTTAIKLLTIQNDKLVLNELINIKDSYVISIIGDARKGKSTFLNIIINFLTNKNKKYFNTSSDIYHCTIGIDYIELIFNDINYIFIDCQGLNYENASHDYQYLLFLYSISNIFIYNDKNIINNNIFSTLQPMALFLNMINNNNKPILFFRIADYDLSGDPMELLNNLFLLRNDQYDNLRESIRLLFSEIKINTTEVMTKNEKKMINENKYDDMLLVENNFIIVIEEIYNLLKLQIKKNINLELLVENINDNSKIDYNKLDIYTLNTKLEIHDFIQKYITTNNEFDEINIDGLETTRQLIEIFNENINKYVLLFEKEFISLPLDLKNIFTNKIKDLRNSYASYSVNNKDTAERKIIVNINKFINDVKTKTNSLKNNMKDSCFLRRSRIYSKDNKDVLRELYDQIDKLVIIFYKDSLKYEFSLYTMFYKNLCKFVKILDTKIKEIIKENDKIIELYDKKLLTLQLKEKINNINNINDAMYGDYKKFINHEIPFNDNDIDSYKYNILIINKIELNYKTNMIDSDLSHTIHNTLTQDIIIKYEILYEDECEKYIELYKERIGFVLDKIIITDSYMSNPLELKNHFYEKLEYISIPFKVRNYRYGATPTYHDGCHVGCHNNFCIIFEEYQFYNLLKKLSINNTIFKHAMTEPKLSKSYYECNCKHILSNIKVFSGRYYINDNNKYQLLYIVMNKIEEFKIKFTEYILENNLTNLIGDNKNIVFYDIFNVRPNYKYNIIPSDEFNIIDYIFS